MVRIDIPIYNKSILISINEKDKALMKQLKGINLTLDDIKRNSKYQRGTAILLDSDDVFIRMYTEVSTPEDYGFFHHELFHAVSMILQSLGLVLNVGSEEAFTYLYGYVTQKAYELMTD